MPDSVPDAGTDADGARERRAAAFAEVARNGQTDLLIEGTVRRVMEGLATERTLLPEIGALRLQLQRLIAVDALEGDPQRVAATMTRVVDGIVRAMRMQHALSGDMSDTVAAAFTTVLLEMGLGEPR